MQVERKAVSRFEIAHPSEVVRRRVVQHAQHERRRVLGNGNFDLRHAALDVECADQFRERGDQVASGRRQHLAHLEIGQQGTAALAEADQHLAFLVDELAADPRSPPVRPYGSRERREPGIRRDAADALERFGHDAPLGGELRRMIEVLQ